SWTRPENSNNYLYNAGSELNGNTGLYEMFFRSYDPALGRMMQVDPYATTYYSFSPYNYSLNNPVTLNDPTGGWVQISPIDSYWDNIIESVEGPRVVHTGGTGGGGIMASEGTRFGFTKVDGDGGGRS